MRGDDWIPAVVAKYRATWQFKAAMKIIAPASQRRAECGTDIIKALSWIETIREVHSTRRTPAELSKHLQKLAKTLRVAVDLADQLGPFDLWPLPIDLDAMPSRI